MRRFSPLILASALAVPLIAACGGDDGPTLRVYSGRHYDIELAFERFSDETGVSVEFLNAGDAELREKIAAEGDETQADVFLTVDAGNLAVAAQDGLFQPLDSPVLDAAIPAELRDPDDQWFALSLRARTVVYDPADVAVEDVPDSYEELADPEWDGRICLRNSANVYQQSLVASLIAEHGEDEARRIVAGWVDDAEVLPNDVLILESIAEGLCDVGITNHYYLARLLEEDPDFPVELHWVDQDGRGVHTNISGGGVTKYADDPDLAQQFLEWLATDGQSIFADGNHEYPANPSVAPETLIAEAFGTDFVRDPLNPAVYGGLNADAVSLMNEVGYP